jgi:hypothetical protein
MSDERELSGARIVASMDNVIAENEQIIRDTTSWNDNVRPAKYPDAAPIDMELSRIAISKAKKIRELVLQGKPVPTSLRRELMEALSQ